MGQANSLPKQLEVFTKQHMNFLLQIKQQPNLLSDSERTRKAFERYLKFMEKKALYGHAAYKDVLVDEIWMWHIHRIHPLKYIADCTAAYGYVIPLKSPSPLPPLPSPLPLLAPTVDLIHSVGKHREFISKVEPLFASTDEHIKHLANQYLKFLKLVPLKEPGKFLIPTIGIDLIWNTHMMIPESYAKDTQAIAGRVLDHDISLSEVDLQANLAYTDELWQKHYKEPYLQNKIDTAMTGTNNNDPGMAVSQPPSSNTSFATQQPILTAATETVLAPSTNISLTQTTIEPTTSPYPSDPSSFNSPSPDTAPETLQATKSEVTWDQDSGSLWLGGGWGETSTGDSDGGDGGSSAGGAAD